MKDTGFGFSIDVIKVEEEDLDSSGLIMKRSGEKEVRL